MKKQKIKSINLLKVFLSALMSFLLSWTAIQAQDVSIGDYMIQDGKTHTVTSVNTSLNKPYLDIKIPSQPNFQYIYFNAMGGDGGKAKNGKTLADAGGGATASAFFEIGSGDNQLKPGSTLRFLIGRAGQRNDWSGGGGGGTGLVYQEPGSGIWKTLLVAGGGGGSAISLDVWNQPKTSIGKSGLAAINPETAHPTESGGGGAIGAPNTTYSDETGEPGMTLNYVPEGGNGGTRDGSPAGGWGFGGGGSGTGKINMKKNGIYAGKGGRGGGGGGYTGGKHGDKGKGGMGGSSYVRNTAITSFKKDGSTITSSQDGYIKYQFSDNTSLMKVKIRVVQDQSKCVDLAKNNQSDGTNIQLWDCNGSAGQDWYFDGTTFQLAENTGQCLDVQGKKTKNSTNIQLYHCSGGTGQQWIYDDATKSIRSKLNINKCLDLKRKNTTNGANIQLYDCNGGTNQQWILE